MGKVAEKVRGCCRQDRVRLVCLMEGPGLSYRREDMGVLRPKGGKGLRGG